ncbi:GDP-mannose 4,6-dehydratase [uncultured archaeon]|nr:GDP-mannose 4,6-dehydratase [uncultured archaeon]
MKRALITGITGQDGSYLAELLLEKGYEVWGAMRRSSSFNTGRIDHIFDDLHLVYADLMDSNSLIRAVEESKPDEVYNLGAQSHVQASFQIPQYSANADAVGVLRLLEAIKGKDIKFYQASSSEMFGSSPAPQTENTPFHPRSPYGVSKVAAYWYGVNYRESYGMHISNGILFNHESPRRGETFLTRKVTRAVARIVKGLQPNLILGNMDAKRDWGYAKEYVEGMWRMLQQPTGDDYVLATGETHTVQEWVEAAFGYVELDWRNYVKTDPRYLRPAEVNVLQGDYTKANLVLGWKPETKFKELVKLMVESDLRAEDLV